MLGILTGFGIIGSIVLAGYAVGRFGILGEGADTAMNRTAFFACSPALLFTLLAEADTRVLFSSFLAVAFLSVVVSAMAYVVMSRLFFRRPVAETVVGATSASYVNSHNIGLPVAIYVLGDPQFVAPVLLMQVVVLTPLILTLLDVSTSSRASIGALVTQPLRNPMIVASALGLALSVTGVSLPSAVMEPFEIVGGGAIPLVLLAFGMSLRGRRPLAPGTGRADVLTSSVVKSVIMPISAFLIGRFMFRLEDHELFAVVVTAGLPTAQNVYSFAARYGRGVVVARDTTLITTVSAIPLLLAVAALLT